jgi:4-diphosphocytidyl-2-C-methyl-D-erythritol kinase
VSTRVLAPCKINPTLSVIGRRADGFHELDTTFLALALADELELSPVRGRAGKLRVEGAFASPDIPDDERNLARRACSLSLRIARAAGRDAPDDFDLRLSKLVPSRAGLGGGSSDAAAAAIGVASATGLSPSDPRLSAALAELGSDTVFFLAARETGHARGRGRGEHIDVLAAPETRPWIVLLAPDFGAPTEVVYRALAVSAESPAERARGEERTLAWTGARSIGELRRALCNDLEPAALRAFPALARWRELLDRHGAGHFRLSGSGSSFFGMFAEEAEAEAESARLAGEARQAGLGMRGAWITRPTAPSAST